MATTGHEQEAINVEGLKAALQELKTDILDGKAEKSEMSVTAGTGTDADKTTIQLKSGTSATVLTTHQTKTDLGLNNVTNDAQVKRTEMGANSGVATLDSTGKITSTQLPDYVTNIDGIVPTQATSSNQLADKSFVNSSISTATATFRGTSATGLTEQQFLAWANALTKDDNDYVFWNTVDSDGNTQFKRYKYDGTQWSYEYTLNNSSFTSAQWAAIESGITSNLVDKLTDLPTNASLTTTLGNKADVTSTVSSVSYDTTNKKIQETINGTTTDVVTASDIVTDGGGYKKPTNGIPDTDLETSYLPTAGGTMSGTITFDGTNKAIHATDPSGSTYRMIGHNAENLWIGANNATTRSYVGELHISSGYDATNNKGNDSIYINIPNDTNTGSNEYRVYHTKNLKVFSNKNMVPSGTSLAGWYRIANLSTDGNGHAFLLSITEDFTNGAPTPSTFLINVGSKVATIRQLGAAVISPKHISAIRVVGNNAGATTYYIDLYYAYSSTSLNNEQKYSLINLGYSFTDYKITKIDWTPQAASDSLPSDEVLYASANVSTTFNADYATNADKLDNYHALGAGTGNIIKQGYINIGANSADKWYKIATLPKNSQYVDTLLYVSSFYLTGDSGDKVRNCIIEVQSRRTSSYFFHTIFGLVGNMPTSYVRLYYNTYNDAEEIYIKFPAHSSQSNRTVVTRVLAETCRQAQSLDNIVLTNNQAIEPTEGWSYTKMTYKDFLGNAASVTNSDERLKNIIEDKQLSINAIADAPLVSFKFKNDKDTDIHVGTIAQYWKNVLPEVVSEDDSEDKYLSLNYPSMNTAMCISLAREVKILTQKVEELEKKLKNK